MPKNRSVAIDHNYMCTHYPGMNTSNGPTIIAFASGKGGVGKSTSCLGIGGALAKAGHQVHIIDFDQTQTLWGWYSSMENAQAIPNLTVEEAPHQNLDVFFQDLYKNRSGYVLIDLAGTMTDMVMLVAALATIVVIPTKLGWADAQEANKLAQRVSALAHKVKKPITCRLLLNEIPFVYGAAQLHMLRLIDQLDIKRFENLLHTRPAYTEPQITGLPLHFDDQSRAPTRKAVQELDLVVEELLSILNINEVKVAA